MGGSVKISAPRYVCAHLMDHGGRRTQPFFCVLYPTGAQRLPASEFIHSISRPHPTCPYRHPENSDPFIILLSIPATRGCPPGYKPSCRMGHSGSV